MSEAKIAVINAAYVDLYLQPDLNSDVVGVVVRGEQFPIMAYQGLGGNCHRIFS